MGPANILDHVSGTLWKMNRNDVLDVRTNAPAPLRREIHFGLAEVTDRSPALRDVLESVSVIRDREAEPPLSAFSVLVGLIELILVAIVGPDPISILFSVPLLIGQLPLSVCLLVLVIES